jgi:hypothetical protein
MSVPMSELGNSLRCPKCKEFGKITFQEVSAKEVKDSFKCGKCATKYQRTYSINQFIRMVEAGLIDPPEIRDFQKKAMIAIGRYIPLEGGMEGVFYIPEEYEEHVRAIGPGLLCKEKFFYHIRISKFKKDKMELEMTCPTCTPKPKKGIMEIKTALILGKAGLIEPDIMAEIREQYRQETEAFDTSETYTGQDGTLSSWAQEELGMIGESKAQKCYICGAPTSEGMSRCPKCGSDL